MMRAGIARLVALLLVAAFLATASAKFSVTTARTRVGVELSAAGVSVSVLALERLARP